jgi:5-methylcytosine-specific restriction endonuclease McrA
MAAVAADGRTAVCGGCGREFDYPATGPERRYCADRECRRRRHARAGWASYQRRLERGIDPRLPAAHIKAVADGSDFSQRFRDADPVALFYETVLAGDPCSYCGGRQRMTPDHIEPWKQGGTGDWENLTACCYACNSSKGDTPLLEWLLTSPRLARLDWLELPFLFPPLRPDATQLPLW